MWIRPGLLDLTYCTNIHPGESWPEVRSNLETHTLGLKDLLSPNDWFGVGLRLSAVATEELLRGSELTKLKTFLDEHHLYISLMNGFPYGAFNCGVVKSDVFAPDWRDEARVHYTLNLLKILQSILPSGVDGGISTLPLSYKPWIRDSSRESKSWQKIVRNLIQVTEALVRVRRETGHMIHLDIEPEPDGLVENTTELIQFFEEVLSDAGVSLLARALGISHQESKNHIFDHIRVCFDTCHLSVEYEDPVDSLRRLQDSGIRIGRIQVSSALHVRFNETAERQEQILAQLGPFSEPNYLHQVIERSSNESLRHYPDLGDALAAVQEVSAREWRIHYHVPLFTAQYGALSSNQQTNREVLSAATKSEITSHLEIETYTWDILPSSLKMDLLPSIAREYQWVMNEVGLRRYNEDSISLQSCASLHE
jgi:sugar phosphate isomerase/epimerase